MLTTGLLLYGLCLDRLIDTMLAVMHNAVICIGRTINMHSRLNNITSIKHNGEICTMVGINVIFEKDKKCDSKQTLSENV